MINKLTQRLFPKRDGIRFPFEDVDVSDARRPLFVVGTGRCGTHFMNSVMEADDTIRSFHTDTLDPVADAFLRYVLWYELPVDLEPWRRFRANLIAAADREGRTYFESNAMVSLAAPHFHEWFNARLVLLVRRPEDVVRSHVIKGWYASIPPRRESERIPGIRPGGIPQHDFGRVHPVGEAYERWAGLTQVGRVSWWINALNLRILELLTPLPADAWRVVKVEAFDHAAYHDLHRILETTPSLSEEAFERIRNQRPGRTHKRKRRAAPAWTDLEWQEFLTETAPLHERLGYPLPDSTVIPT